MTPIVVIYARDRFDVGSTGLGVMMAAAALGHASGALFVAATGGFKRKAFSMMFAVALYATAQIGFGFSTNYAASLVLLYLTAFAIPIWVSSVVTLLQTETDPKMLGRVMSLFALTMQGLFLGAMAGAWLGAQIGNDVMPMYSAIAFFGVHAVLLILSPAVRSCSRSTNAGRPSGELDVAPTRAVWLSAASEFEASY